MDWFDSLDPRFYSVDFDYLIFVPETSRDFKELTGYSAKVFKGLAGLLKAGLR